MVSQPLTVAYPWIRGCEWVPIAQVSRSQIHHKLTEVHRVTRHNLTFHQIRVSQTIQRRLEVGLPTRISHGAKAD
eukprot:278146-Pelagomonas_calceolata.AAC.1